jgi:hypothetical protein
MIHLRSAISTVVAAPMPIMSNGVSRSSTSGDTMLIRWYMASTASRAALARMVEGSVMRKNSMKRRQATRLGRGVNVRPSSKVWLSWRCGRKMAGEPSQEVPG